MSSYKIKKKYLIGLGSWLMELNLSGLYSRSRTRFVELIKAEIAKTEIERHEIVKKYVEFDETTKKFKTKMVGDEEHYDIPDDKRDEFLKELTELENEEFIVDITDSTSVMLRAVKSSVLNTTYEFGPKESSNHMERLAKLRQAEDYNEWCKSFEACEQL